MTARASQRGAALIVVLSVLTMLLVIATPFLMQAKKDQRNAIIASERQRAKAVAEAALRHARTRLERTHQGLEALQGGFKTPYWDGPEELRVDEHPEEWSRLLGLDDGPRYMGDPRGDMWSIDVRDEQSFINADTAPPFVLGALVGRAILTADCEPSSGELQVDSIAGFKPQGGKLMIGFEVVDYRRAANGALTGVSLQHNYKSGTYVYNYFAWELAKFNYAAPRADGEYVTMPSPTVLKEVAGYGSQALEEKDLDAVFGPLTVHGHRPTTSGWLAPQRVISSIDPEDYVPENGGQPLTVRNPDYFNTGTVVRITDGATTEYNVVNACYRSGEQGRILLQDRIGRVYDADTATISAEMRHPVNVNACSKRVLELLLTGLQWRGATTADPYDENRVSPDLAAELADVIVKNRPLRGMEHLIDLLAALYHVKQGSFTEDPEVGISSSDVDTGRGAGATFTPAMALAVVQNAINPCHRELRTSTMPFAFTSHDYFTVEAQASVNDAGGTERARYRLRETFKTAPPRELVIRLDTQAEFEEAVVAGRQGRFVETHPQPMSFHTFFTAKPEPRYMRNMLYFESPDRRGIFADRETGEVRLQPARMQARNGGFEEHFDGDVSGVVTLGQHARNTGVAPELIVPEGWPLRNGAFELPLEGRGNADVIDQLGMIPFVVELWMKPEAFGQGPVLLSVTGADPQTDFIRAWYEPGDRSFHFKAHDNTIDSSAVGVGGSTAIEEAAEVVWEAPPSSVEDDTWYHFSLHVGGTRPGDLLLDVDGRKVGKAKFASRLTRAFSDNDTQFEVEDADGWPDEGAFWIGNEVVTAVRTSAGTYTVFDNPNGSGSNIPYGRGARGTEAASHARGEAVRVYGYSLPLSQATTNLAGEVVAEGGGALTSDLAPFNCCGIKGQQIESIIVNNMPFGSVETLDLSTVSQIELLPMPNASLSVDQETFQAGGGYAIIVAGVTPVMPSPGDSLADAIRRVFTNVIMIRYSARQGNTLSGVQAVPNPFNPALAHGQKLPGNTYTFHCSTLPKIITRAGGGGPNEPPRCAIFPISVHLTDAEGYRDPELTANGPAEEYVQIGNPPLEPKLSDFSSFAVEWVGFRSIDRQGGFLISNDASALQNAAVIAQVALFPTMGMPMKPDVDVMNDWLEFRSQADTEQFQFNLVGGANSVHSAGTIAIPTFPISDVFVPPGGVVSLEQTVGFGDQVTVISPVDKHRSRRTIAWAYEDRAAFSSNLPVRLHQINLPLGARGRDDIDRRRYTRLVKFPSGEMPNIGQGAEAWVGGDSAAATSAGLIDEIRMRRLERERWVIWDVSQVGPVLPLPDPYPLAVSDSDTDIPVVQSRWVPDLPAAPTSVQQTTYNWLVDGRELLIDANTLGRLPADAGLVQIGDELIAYRGIDQGGRLLDCERGFLGTVAAEHSYGEDVTFLDWRAVSRLSNQVQPADYNVIVASAQDFNPNGGTVLIGREMMHYTRTIGPVLVQPRGIDEKDGTEIGIFRGRYGTLRGSHTTDDIVLDMPFRYWDRYARSSDDPELAFYEFAVNEPRAFFRRLEWTHQFPKPRIGMRVLCRLDPTVPWETPPESSGGRILEFDAESGQTEEYLDRALLNLNGRGMDVRVFFTYEQNAFDPDMFDANDWKETGRLLDFTVAYLAAPLVLKREVVR